MISETKKIEESPWHFLDVLQLKKLFWPAQGAPEQQRSSGFQNLSVFKWQKKGNWQRWTCFDCEWLSCTKICLKSRFVDLRTLVSQREVVLLKVNCGNVQLSDQLLYNRRLDLHDNTVLFRGWNICKNRHSCQKESWNSRKLYRIFMGLMWFHMI